MTTRSRLASRVLLTLPIAVLAFWLAFRGVRSEELLQTLRGLRPAPLIAALLVMVLQVALRVGRWVLLVRGYRELPALPVARVGAIGFMAIDVLPARLGELVRPVLLRRQQGVPVGAGFGVIAVERLFDLSALVLALGAALLAADLPSWQIEVFGRSVQLAVEGRNALLVTVCVIAVPAVLLASQGGRGGDLIEAWFRWLPGGLAGRVASLVRTAGEAIRSQLDGPRLLSAFALSLGVWTCNAAITGLLLAGVGAPVGPVESLVVMIVVSIALMLPSPAGGLGVFEMGAVAGASVYGVAAAPAAAFAVALHALHVGVLVLAGLVALGAEGLAWRDLWATEP